MKQISRTILLGLLTAAPLIITWFIVTFLFNWLSSIGQPWVRGLAFGIRPRYPWLADLMLSEALQSAVAVLVVLMVLFGLGSLAGLVIGQRLIGFFERLISSIPFVDSIYRATKRFVSVAGNKAEGERRVVLIEFPTSHMKTLGLVTKLMRDSSTGEELAAVYVPTAPNPTSGYVEIVPVSRIVYLDWSFDQAMSFIVTGGSNGPDEIDFSGGGNASAVAPASLREVLPEAGPGAVAPSQRDSSPPGSPPGSPPESAPAVRA